MNYAPVSDLLRECYTSGQTLGEAFALYMTKLFGTQGWW